jgi:teichuronic acid biosynthesis glycosyltransferase TuaG
MTDLSSDQPLITIVTPAYNAEKFIAATLQSALSQSFGQFEHLVLDDRSTDRTADIAEEFAAHDNRLRVIRLPRNFGAPAGPRNIGVQQARGKWIAFLDADDIWHTDKLRCQLEALQRSGARFCSTRMIDFQDESEVLFEPAGDYKIRRISFRSQLLRYQTPTSTVMVDASVIRATPFNEDLTYKAREDLDCWLHCHELLGHSVKIEHAMMGYRLSPQQISGKKWLMVKRHHHVLRNYRFRAGRRLGLAALLFTGTHFGLAGLNRLVAGKGRL